ncbi:flagellar assembly protein FliW [Paenibacillus sp. UMB4589-SE434]|uniref:flagellar assembly protein FliW n=1 Tax=Paenibacillus sp. UMB4589-SE434 TaxID=3046314 RepID=UPI00254EFBAC|nr:flagellar assembly protein FliW [Paenibacillus sp. UMB4589-SE434]MDK8181632.1 flagellar assembly protein FliW [Paenibacillus sp. UMB4589-SE434]
MIEIRSTRLGQLMVDESEIVCFPEGILGFSAHKQYAWLSADSEDSVIELLQSADEENLTFIITDPFLFEKNYSFDLNEDWNNKLKISSIEQAIVRVIVTAKADGSTTINLKAPIIINKDTNNAVQIILDGPEYPLQHPVGGGR